MLCNPFESLADAELEQNLLALARVERDTNANIILHLMVVQERQLYVPAGYDSLFSYCVGKLGFSRSTAYRRKAVVDKVADFPELIERLRDGRLHLCAAAKIATHLETETAAELLEAVVGMSHREVEVYLVKRHPVKARINVDTKSRRHGHQQGECQSEAEARLLRPNPCSLATTSRRNSASGPTAVAPPSFLLVWRRTQRSGGVRRGGTRPQHSHVPTEPSPPRW